jgi:hypothetical protein
MYTVWDDGDVQKLSHPEKKINPAKRRIIKKIMKFFMRDSLTENKKKIIFGVYFSKIIC